VYAGLEAVRVLQWAVRDRSRAPALARPIDVVCFTEEEGHRFSGGLLGSSVVAGSCPLADALSVQDDRGETLGDALESIGFRGDGRLEAERWDAWLELHVEQGSRLERAGVPVGVVTSIAGTTRATVEITGQTNHAGTTAMTDRADALAAASEVVLAVEAAAAELAERNGTAVGTVGRLDAEPNTVNVVPGRAVLELDLRDVATAGIDDLLGRIERSLDRIESDRPVSVHLDRHYDAPPRRR
jgi:N-carbamoyl-L-amino-acid hydrolase